MPRPQRCRRVCALPQSEEFYPSKTSTTAVDTVILSLDEYEVIRLIDVIGFTQAQCAVQIGVSRTTVTGIYELARRKIADALVYGKRLLIEGGNIQLCERAGACCAACCCRSPRPEQKKEIDNNE